MHNYSIEYAKTYRSDIIHILDYISVDNVIAAVSLNQKIEDAISTLSSFPFKGTIPNDAHLRLKGYRMIIIDNYIIFYIPSALDEMIKVHRVLSSKQNYIDFL